MPKSDAIPGDAGASELEQAEILRTTRAAPIWRRHPNVVGTPKPQALKTQSAGTALIHLTALSPVHAGCELILTAGFGSRLRFVSEHRIPGVTGRVLVDPGTPTRVKAVRQSEDDHHQHRHDDQSRHAFDIPQAAGLKRRAGRALGYTAHSPCPFPSTETRTTRPTAVFAVWPPCPMSPRMPNGPIIRTARLLLETPCPKAGRRGYVCGAERSSPHARRQRTRLGFARKHRKQASSLTAGPYSARCSWPGS